MQVNLKENEMEIGETRTYSDCQRQKYDVEITRTSESTFAYRIITILCASGEFNTRDEAKSDAEKELSKLP